ncbi:extracellular solute-binding protein [Clostridium sp. KNHs205]|jgi:raffinose/stachyose/melibiose transport system substrate-binding protein|uniref:ABC transporter substrate-binding protein n=1 Tax=Clostridium sp. KNHs205 TaxID=1449050 RepID=UPI00051C2ADC|nr:extracellular solute-binding protein [Clostridium sp. KNHs205]
MRKIWAFMLVTAMVLSMLAGCGSKKEETAVTDKGVTDTEKTGTEKTEATKAPEKVTLKLFSNLPDRKNGQGLVEQMIIDEYMEANPNVTIQVEALDEEAYKTKFKAYAMDGMPDVVSIWGQPSFLGEVLDAGVLAELKEADYANYGFVSGSLEGFKKDGKLYGLPRNTDIMAFYYNKKMFEDNGWKVPATYEELLTLSAAIKEKDIIPVAMDGGDGWPMAIYLTDLLVRIEGKDAAALINEAVAAGDFSDSRFTQAVDLLVQSARAGMFQTGYDSQDYGTAMNLFTNGQAAMFYMGSWESSMALNNDITEDIRNNVRAFTMPAINGGKGSQNDIAAWNGGGYAVAADSKVKDEAIKFLNFMYQPDKLSKYGWEKGVGMSAQDQSAYMTGNETELQKTFTDILKNATSVSGTPINDCGPSAFKAAIESEIQSVSNGTSSVDDFLAKIGEACK